MFVDGPHSSKKPAGCTTGKGWVGIDYAWVVLHGLTALAWMSINAEAESDPNLEAPGNAPVFVNVGWMAVHTMSAISGNSNVNKCREAYDNEDND